MSYPFESIYSEYPSVCPEPSEVADLLAQAAAVTTDLRDATLDRIGPLGRRDLAAQLRHFLATAVDPAYVAGLDEHLQVQAKARAVKVGKLTNIGG